MRSATARASSTEMAVLPGGHLSFSSSRISPNRLRSSSRSIDFAYESLGWDWERFAEAAGAQARKKRDELNEIRKQLI